MLNIVRRTERYVQKIVKAGQVAPKLAVLTAWMVAGILEGKSVHLSNVARALDEDEELMTTEKRLSRAMADDRQDDEALRVGYWKTARRALERCEFICADITDISKPHGRAFEHQAVVRDASSKRKNLEPGFWGVWLEGTTKDHKNVPIDLQMYSPEDPEYLGWNETFEACVARALPYLPTSATWLMDRGFDSVRNMKFLNSHGLKWAIRQRQNRDILVGERKLPMSWVSQTLETPYTVMVPYVHKKTHELRRTTAQFNFIPVELPDLAGNYTLIVLSGMHKERMVLLVNRRIGDSYRAARLIRAYLRRWGIEEGIRMLKQKTGLEDFRVRNWTAINRVALMAMLAYGFLALLLHHAPKAAERFIERVKVFIREVLFPYYRLWDGVTDAFIRG